MHQTASSAHVSRLFISYYYDLKKDSLLDNEMVGLELGLGLGLWLGLGLGLGGGGGGGGGGGSGLIPGYRLC